MSARSEYFDSIAERWDGFCDLDQQDTKLASKLGRLDLDGAATIVDLGCGTGNLSRFLIAHAPDLVTLHAVDFSPGMIDVARRKVKDPRVTWHTKDVAHLSLRDGSVDLAICFSAWPHFPDPAAVLDEMRRILKPSGRLVVMHLDSKETINAIHTSVGGAVGTDLLPPARDLAALMRTRGFEVESAVDTQEEYWVSARRSDG